MNRQARTGPMSRRAMMKLAAGAAISSLGHGAPAPQDAPAKPPNVVVFLADDMGYSDPGCYGGEVKTPNLDRLAAGGIRFTQCYSTARCAPSRGCILSGYYSQQSGMEQGRATAASWVRFLPQHLKPLGYRSYHSGKWHVPVKPVAGAGFDRSYCLNDHNRFFKPENHWVDDQPIPAVKEGEKYYATTSIAQYGIDFLKEHAAKHASDRFFLYMAFISPHFPLHAPQEDIAKYRDTYNVGWDVIRERRWRRMREMGLVDTKLSALEPDMRPPWNTRDAELKKRIGPGESTRAMAWKDLTAEERSFQPVKMAIHAAMVSRMDAEIGRVLEQLKAMDAERDTVVIFISDNGASAEQIIRGDGHDRGAAPGSGETFLCLGPGWSSAANTPFRLHKSWVHEGGISSPLIVHWPNGIKGGGGLRRSPCHFIDLVPTIRELAGAKIPAGASASAPPFPGRSLTPAFEKDAPIARDYLFFHHLDNRAVRVGDWKLVSSGNYNSFELYNLKTDRAESNDLADANPEKVREMSALWTRLSAEFRKQSSR